MKKPEIRYLNDIKKVLYDKKWLKTAANFELYYIYRGIKEKGEIRYDVTIIPQKMLGQEFVKTKGHYHSENFGELYKVLSGRAIFLVQKEKNGKIEDVYYIKTSKGEYALIPPDYGHTIINYSKSTLKIANWISKKCKSDYTKIEQKRGFCYYYTKKGWLKNKKYKFSSLKEMKNKKIPKLKFKRPLKVMPKDLSFITGI